MEVWQHPRHSALPVFHDMGSSQGVSLDDKSMHFQEGSPSGKLMPARTLSCMWPSTCSSPGTGPVLGAVSSRAQEKRLRFYAGQVRPDCDAEGRGVRNGACPCAKQPGWLSHTRAEYSEAWPGRGDTSCSKHPLSTTDSEFQIQFHLPPGATCLQVPVHSHPSREPHPCSA